MVHTATVTSAAAAATKYDFSQTCRILFEKKTYQCAHEKSKRKDSTQINKYSISKSLVGLIKILHRTSMIVFFFSLLSTKCTSLFYSLIMSFIQILNFFSLSLELDLFLFITFNRVIVCSFTNMIIDYDLTYYFI